MRKANARKILMVVKSLKKRNYVDKELIHAESVKAIKIIDNYVDSKQINTSNFNSHGLVNTANVFAKMRHVQLYLFEHVMITNIYIIDTFNTQELAIIANTFVRMEYPHPKLFNSIPIMVLHIVHTFKGHGISNILTAFATIHHSHL